MKTFQKKKRCYFFCYESVLESKNVRKSVKSQVLGLERFFVKGSKMEKIVSSAGTENWILILYTYFSFLPISCRRVIVLKLFCNVLDHSKYVDDNNDC